MRRLLLTLVALTMGTARAQLLPMNLPFRMLESTLPEGNTSPSTPLMTRQQTRRSCGADANNCDEGCIPRGGQCCNAGDGGWCNSGTFCQNGGCCPTGQDCSGPISSCPDGHVLCGNKCMPRGASCCAGDNYYCGAGTTCTNRGLCADGRGITGCTSDETICGIGCIPSGQICCKTYHCPPSYVCGRTEFECAVSSMTNGGNLTGGGGNGTSTQCDGPFEACGTSCMPKGGTCCDGFYCPAGQMCAPDQKCVDPNNDGDDNESNKTSTTIASSTKPNENSPTATGGNESVAAHQIEVGRLGLITSLAIMYILAD